MTSRERVKRAIHFQGPDRLPHYLPDGKENDLIWLWPGRSAPQQPETLLPDGRKRKVDAWGVTWETMGGGSFGEAVAWPLSDITRQQKYIFPDLHNPAHFISIREAITANKSDKNPRYCLGVMPCSSLNEGTHNLMGLENMFTAYYEHPEDLHAWLARLAAMQRESIKILADLGCDGVMGYDDWGLQDRLMVSPELIEGFFMPHYRENWALAHKLGMDVWMHSCGYIIDLLPMLKDAGLDVIQQDQQENMGLENLDSKIGGKLAFWCPVDVQKTMIGGSIDEIRAYVRRMIATIGNHHGGLVSMAYSTPQAVGHAPEKTASMCAAFREYGIYKKE
ncbi:MAG: uroporphyrinogen decarboxylase family protein [Victivallales bacterium]